MLPNIFYKDEILRANQHVHYFTVRGISFTARNALEQYCHLNRKKDHV